MMMAVTVPVTLFMDIFMHMVGAHAAGSSGHHTGHVFELNGRMMNAQRAKRIVNVL